MASKPKFSIGDTLRYGHGPTALFKVSTISANHAGPGQHRYYGQHCLGGIQGAYESDCKAATKDDLQTWDESAKWRHNK